MLAGVDLSVIQHKTFLQRVGRVTNRIRKALSSNPFTECYHVVNTAYAETYRQV